MDDRQVCSEIAYLDNFSEAEARSEAASSHMAAAVVLAAIHLEMAKQAHWPNPEDVALRLASLEAMRRVMLTNHRGYPVVQYVSVSQPRLTVPATIPAERRYRFPKSLVVFYCLGLVFSLSFAILLALSAFGTSLIHPFLALLGFVGGIGWLTTAWSDLLLLKAETPWHLMTTRSSSENPDHQPELAAAGKR
jgi:hypothetical protein